MTGTENGVDSLVGQTQSSLSLSSSAGKSDADAQSPSNSSSPTTSNGSISSLSPTSPKSSRQSYGIGSGSGGPPPRPNNIGTGGPSFRGGPASGGPPSANNMATGGPGSRMRANEMTKQLASTKLPPGLQARLAAVSRIQSQRGIDKLTHFYYISRMPIEQARILLALVVLHQVCKLLLLESVTMID
jgi:hypothetical protein